MCEACKELLSFGRLIDPLQHGFPLDDLGGLSLVTIR